jgi:two-component system, chemotaxis family, chemotaxis protein CheY
MSNKVLVIDDSLMVRRQVGGALKNLGYTVVEAVDGLDAIEKLATNTDARLIVCDVNMPRMSGLEFLESVSAKGSKVPVIMLTTEGEPEMIQKAKALGAKGWLLKPFKPEFLESTARMWAPIKP